MKQFLINLFGELPLLMVFCAGFIIIDRMAFSNKLWGLIVAGWKKGLKKRWQKLRLGRTPIIPLQPADYREILETVAYSKCTEGHGGAVTPENENPDDSSDTLATHKDGSDHEPTVSPEDYDRVFSDSRDMYDDSDTEPGDENDVDWGDNAPPEELVDDTPYEDTGYDDRDATYFVLIAETDSE